eukprot:2775158-Amphidinium_carterae.1
MPQVIATRRIETLVSLVVARHLLGLAEGFCKYFARFLTHHALLSTTWHEFKTQPNGALHDSNVPPFRSVVSKMA